MGTRASYAIFCDLRHAGIEVPGGMPWRPARADVTVSMVATVDGRVTGWVSSERSVPGGVGARSPRSSVGAQAVAPDGAPLEVRWFLRSGRARVGGGVLRWIEPLLDDAGGRPERRGDRYLAPMLPIVGIRQRGMGGLEVRVRIAARPCGPGLRRLA